MNATEFTIIEENASIMGGSESTIGDNKSEDCEAEVAEREVFSFSLCSAEEDPPCTR